MNIKNSEQDNTSSILDELFLPPSQEVMTDRFTLDGPAPCSSHCKSPGGCLVVY